MSEPAAPVSAAEAISKEEELFKVRLGKVESLRQRGAHPFGNGVAPKNTAAEIHAAHAEQDGPAVEAAHAAYSVAGRIVAMRTFGKAAFIKLRDRTGELQAHIRKDLLGDSTYELFSKDVDVGDYVFVSGEAFRTKTGELSISAKEFKFLTKSLRPLPEKWHGLSDVETRYRQRYLDLVSTYPDVQKIFRLRSKLIRGIQHFLDAKDFLEVETPMLHKPEEAGGAAARPFETHHNALSLELKLRIATELHLKRLVVGGMERVYEIGRIFRNEGIDRRHNPEFTTIEFYWAYATYEDLIELTEALFERLAIDLLGKAELTYQGQVISLARPFPQVSMVKSVIEHLKAHGNFDAGSFDDLNGKHATTIRALATYCQTAGGDRALTVCRSWFAEGGHGELAIPQAGGKEVDSVGEAISVLFEHLVEPTLDRSRPVFVTDFPLEVSPLARRRDSDPRLTDRFELYMAGMEVANAFSELNDPIDQKQRFEKQMERKAKGDSEAMPYDADFIRALEHGMPPTAGEGIGIDRLVMLFTDQPNIREVILFPLLKPLG